MDSRAERQLEIFEKAISLPPQERDAYLDSACGREGQVRQAVERLLGAHDNSGILDRPGSPAVEQARRQVQQIAAEGVEGILEKPGDLLGKYRLRRLLGEGGFGAVFLADQQGPLSRRVALKIIKPGMDTRPVIARFEAERQALALMEHPCIAKVFDAGTTAAGRPYFVMEYVQGQSITQYCDQHRLGLKDRLELFAQAARAVHHAHQKGVIHRDLKPSNIMVCRTEGEATPKVIDFGIAKAMHQPLTESTLLTQHGQVIGTPEYMSPEQAGTSGADVDIRTDVYSLGVVLYELLTGVRPFDQQERRQEWLQEIQGIDPPRPSQRVARLGERAANVALSRNAAPHSLERQLRNELDWIVLKAIARERARRYDSVAALAADVQAHLENRPVQATPPSASYRLGKFVRRHKAWISAAAVALLALVLGLALAILGLVEASRQRDTAQAARDEAEAVVGFLSGMLASADPAEKGRDVTVVEVLDQSAFKLIDSFADQPLVKARLHHTVGRTYWSLGRGPAAVSHLQEATSIRERELGAAHLDTLTSLASLGAVLYVQGRASQAEPLLQRALQGLRQTQGDEHQFTLGVMNNLAQLKSNTGRLEEAVQLQAEVLAGQTRTLGADHPHTLGSRLNLAQLQIESGNAQEGILLLEQAWEAWKQAHGENHPGTLMALQNLANALRFRDDLQQAEALSRQVWQARQQLLGETHPETWGSQYNLAEILAERGRPQESAQLLLAIVLAPPDAGYPPVRTTAAIGLLTAYADQGWPRSSRPSLRPASDLLRSLVQSPDASATQLNNAAWLLLALPDPDLRDPSLALQAAQRACQQERQGEAAQLWLFLDTLAQAQHANGQSRLAVDSLKEALQLIPADNQAGRAEIEGRLKTYQSAVAKGGS